MSIAVSQLDVHSIARPSDVPRFPFVERLRERSKAFSLGSCSVLVAPEDCLIPRFAYGFQAPGIADFGQAEIAAVLEAMSEVSCGFLWFDNFDVDAYTLAWRARLRVRAVSPLFDGSPVSRAAAGVNSNDAGTRITFGSISSAESSSFVKSLLGATPVDRGGLDNDSVDRLSNSDQLQVVKIDGVDAGAVTFIRGGGDHVAVGGRVGSEGGRAAAEELAIAAFSKVVAAGLKPLYGVANGDVAGHRLATSLRLPLVNQGWVAQLGDF